MKLLTVKKMFLQDFIKHTYEFSWTRLPTENFIKDQLIYQIVWRISIVAINNHGESNSRCN